MGKVTIVEVAKAADVSISSVSRYLSNPKSINPISAVRIAKAIGELHYVPNLSARNLKRGTTKVIGFIQPDITQELFNKAMKAINDMFFQNDYLLITCDSDNNPEKELRHINALIEQNVAGIIIAPCSYQSEAALNTLSNFGNYVFLDRLPNTDMLVSSVIEDNREKCVLLTEAILSKPQKKYLLLAGAEHSYVTKERTSAIRETFHNHGIALNSNDIIYNQNSSEETIQMVASKLEEGYNALIFTNPKILNSIYIASKKLGLKINRDISIAGYSYESTLNQYEFQFPCVVQHPYELGLAAGDIILKKINKKNAMPKQVIIPCDFRNENQLTL